MWEVNKCECGVVEGSKQVSREVNKCECGVVIERGDQVRADEYREDERLHPFGLTVSARSIVKAIALS